MIKAWNRLGSIRATRRSTRSRLASFISLALVASGVTISGCSDGISPPAPLSDDPYVALRFNTNVATMSTVAPYNVLQLTATPYTASGTRLTTTSAVVYSTQDTAVTLTSSGTVTAHYATTVPAVVVASLQDSASNVTRVDTMYITVTTTVPTTSLASLAIVRQPGDTAKLPVATQALWGLFPLDTLRVAVAGADGTDLRSRVSLRFMSSDTSIARVDPLTGRVQGLQPGTVTIRVGTTYYGVTQRDSVQLTIGNPVVVAIRAYPVVSPTVAGQYIRIYDPNTITIGVGGTVVFYAGVSSSPSPTPLSWDVIFDTPDEAQASTLPPSALGLLGSNTGAGNIAPAPPYLLSDGTSNPACVAFLVCLGATRSFLHAGTYHYHSALYGTSGTIVVTP